MGLPGTVLVAGWSEGLTPKVALASSEGLSTLEAAEERQVSLCKWDSLGSCPRRCLRGHTLQTDGPVWIYPGPVTSCSSFRTTSYLWVSGPFLSSKVGPLESVVFTLSLDGTQHNLEKVRGSLKECRWWTVSTCTEAQEQAKLCSPGFHLPSLSLPLQTLIFLFRWPYKVSLTLTSCKVIVPPPSNQIYQPGSLEVESGKGNSSASPSSIFPICC